jgi:hypothetical protein
LLHQIDDESDSFVLMHDMQIQIIFQEPLIDTQHLLHNEYAINYEVEIGLCKNMRQ